MVNLVTKIKDRNKMIITSDKKKNRPSQYIAMYCDGQVFLISGFFFVKSGTTFQKTGFEFSLDSIRKCKK